MEPYLNSLKILDIDSKNPRCMEDMVKYIDDRIEKSPMSLELMPYLISQMKSRADSNFQWIRTMLKIADEDPKAAQQVLNGEDILTPDLANWYNTELRIKFINRDGIDDFQKHWTFNTQFVPMFSLLTAFRLPMPVELLENNDLVEDLTDSESDGYDMADAINKLSEFMKEEEKDGVSYVSFLRISICFCNTSHCCSTSFLIKSHAPIEYFFKPRVESAYCLFSI